MSEQSSNNITKLTGGLPQRHHLRRQRARANYATICGHQPEGFYLTTLCHEWFVIDYDAEAKALLGS